MAMPLRQTIKVATYLFEQKLRKRDKFPLTALGRYVHGEPFSGKGS